MASPCEDLGTAVARVTALYCHALDRRAWDRLDACFHADATYRFGSIDGGWQTFVATARTLLDACSATHHQLGQSLVAPDGESGADVETYFTALHRVPANTDTGGFFQRASFAQDVLVHGRYLDRFERRANGWRIAHRTGLFDARHDRPAADGDFDAMPAHWRGAVGRADPAHSISARLILVENRS